MIFTEYAVSTIYASNEDPEGLEEGFEIKTAREGSGRIDAVAIIDHAEGDILQAPIEVALLFADMVQTLLLRPLAPAPDSETVVFVSDDIPGLDQDGYIITVERDLRDRVEAIVFCDCNEDVEICCAPDVAQAMAVAIKALDAFPRSTLH
ncbi:hypothetical protein KABACHOK_02350 [Brevundimonas phage vB_BpoS-Kabachok]|uniref:Uncharacterized protein n=1 Tax=Brevundimonas phage vB_BpoS-Kabachok TaxID=2948600 RepID=A0A9E7MNS3_9CAUD|nr:hypothetical protein KABACHOK_02350 [Brevundimonas phage vB_BpoS-Kabachok]